MRRLLALFASATLLPVGVSGQGWMEVESDEVSAGEFLPGAIAHRTLVLLLPDGAAVEWPETLSLGVDAESAGEPVVDRELVADGRVRWRIKYPFTAWSVGEDTIGPLSLLVTFGPLRTEVKLEPVSFRVTSPLGDGAGVLPPAAPEGPFQPGRFPWELLPLAPLAVAGLTGAGWLRSGRGSGAGEGRDALVAPGQGAGQRTDPRDLMERGLGLLEEEPGEAVLLLATGVRALRLGTLPTIQPSTSTAEVCSLVEAGVTPELSAPVRYVLISADAWRFGGVIPDIDEVRVRVAALEVGLADV